MWMAAAILAAGLGAGGAALAAAPKNRPKADEAANRQAVVARAKKAFLASVAACERPGICDPKSPSVNRELLQGLEGAEKGFMQACTACASDERCEAERERIRGGGGRSTRSPCE
jgi:formate-dependent phosphoribosylglycinamide formyltransferase (GAR transformylase)